MRDRIAIDARIHFGKSCIAGTRIPVQNVLELVRDGVTFADIRRDCYLELQPEDIRACIQYAIDVLAMETRVRRASRKKFEAVLRAVPDVEPEPFDRFPNGPAKRKGR